MTREDKRLLLKDLCARLPYGVKVLVNNKIHTINAFYDDGSAWLDDKVDCSREEIKPYLRPMESMTEEEKKLLKVDICPDGTGSFNKEGLIVPATHYGDLIHYVFMETILSWLREKHFDYNNLIERGLALEAPDGMYEK